MIHAEYDPDIVQTFANNLYDAANRIIVVWTVGGAAVGAGVGYALGSFDAVYAIPGAVVFGLFGYVIGKQRAFSLKLQAQVALCQKQIEENTRK